ncbi:MAG: DUF3363 domain-containing protein [Burkholderiales bacterium]
MAGRRDDERFEIAPRQPRGASDASQPVARVAKSIWHYARQSRFAGKATPSPSTPALPHLQRCAVRITYASNRVRGQWRAHGRYVAREAATDRDSAESRDSPFTEPTRDRNPPAGYDRAREGLDLAAELDAWQGAGDPRLFKLILSPEFGDRVDLQTLTRETLASLEHRLGKRLTWVAVNHYNTEHPHVHVALRGVDARGNPLLLPRELVKQGIREIAQEACTRQLGYRTHQDRVRAEARETVLTRVTSHDKRIRAVAERLPEGQLRVTPHRAPGLSPSQKEGLRARLVHLQAMRLATADRHGSWLVAGDFENALTALAEGADRQRSLARVQAMISDPHRPAVVTRGGDLGAFPGRRIAGRVLGHGESEAGSGYLLLEGVDGNVHYFAHVFETERAHARGDLRAGHFVELSAGTAEAGGRAPLRVRTLGDASQWLRDRAALSRWERGYLRAGGTIAPGTDKGWLGQFAAARDSLRSVSRGRER